MNDQGDEELRDILRHLATRLTSLEDKLANVADHIDSSSRVLGNRIEALERRSTTRPSVTLVATMAAPPARRGR